MSGSASTCHDNSCRCDAALSDPIAMYGHRKIIAASMSASGTRNGNLVLLDCFEYISPALAGQRCSYDSQMKSNGRYRRAGHNKVHKSLTPPRPSITDHQRNASQSKFLGVMAARTFHLLLAVEKVDPGNGCPSNLESDVKSVSWESPRLLWTS